MTTKEFDKWLKSIGGLENGYSPYPYKWGSLKNKIAFKLFICLKWVGISDNKNPFRSKIKNSGFFEVRDGWLQLVKDCTEELIAAGWDKQVCQVKSKFAGLRYYINTGSKEIFDIISKYEDISYKTCEVCGEPGIERGGGWIKTLCDEHNKK